jgi:tRNA-2-methylthio-N6-dimethylallyladenosine synthase
VAQQEGENLLNSYKDVSFIFGTDAIDKLYEIIDLVQKGERVCYIQTDEKSISIPLFRRKSKVSAYVTIMKGCDNFCSYCIVPYVRGREKSRSPFEIIEEIKYLVDNGVKEVTLLGQNVNSYGKNLDENINFPKLLYMINEIDKLKRVRFVTSHPKDFSDELIDALKDCEKLAPYLHLPLQSGSNSILKRMNRNYTYEQYLDKVLKAKDKIENLALSSDFIVGFPGETDRDFNDTLRAIREIEYETIFAFKYSPRPKTKAFNFEDNVDDSIKSKRLDILLKEQEKISSKLLNSYVNKYSEVLVEGKSKKDENIYSGRNLQNRVVNFKSKYKLEIGDIVNVYITEAKKNSLFGKYE